MEHVAQKKNGVLVYLYPKAYESDIKQFSDGEYIRVTLGKPRRPKTLKQLGYYYAAILPAVHLRLLELGWEVDGVPISEEMTDTWLKYKCGGAKLKRDMSIDEAKTFIDNVIRLCAIRLELEISEPQER